MKKEIKPFKIKEVTFEQRKVILDVLAPFYIYRLNLDDFSSVNYYFKGDDLLWGDSMGTFQSDSLPEITYQQFYDMYVERYFRLKPEAAGWKSELNSKNIFKGSYKSSYNIGCDILYLATKGCCQDDWEEVTYEDWLTQEQTKNKTMEKVGVRVDFLKELHQEVCTPLKTKMEKELPEVFNPVTYKIGQRFTDKYAGIVHQYLLAYLGNGRIGLVNLRTGSVYLSIDAQDINVEKITQQDWPTLFNNYDLVE